MKEKYLNYAILDEDTETFVSVSLSSMKTSDFPLFILDDSSQNNIDLLGTVAEYNANNTWNFNGTNRTLNNNNRYNGNFRARPVLDFRYFHDDGVLDSSNKIVKCYDNAHYDKVCYDNSLLSSYNISLESLIDMEQFNRVKKKAFYLYNKNFSHNIIALCHKINNREFDIVKLFAFVVKVPKLREIVYCSYEGKIMQSFYSCTVRFYLERLFFVFDSYSCRENKGIERAINNLVKYIKEDSENYTKDCWLAHIDLENFFMSIDCKLAASLMKDFISDKCSQNPYKEELLYLTDIFLLNNYSPDSIIKIAGSDFECVPKHKSFINREPFIGVSAGNWTSQIVGNFITTFALIHLGKLGYKYIHYTDDSCIVVKDKKRFMKDLEDLRDFYKEKLHLKLHKHKFYIQHYSKGVQMLGRKVRFNRVLPSNGLHNRIMQCVKHYLAFSGDSKKMYSNVENFRNSLNSYLGMLKHMNSYKLRKEIIESIKKTAWSKVLWFDLKDYLKVSIRPGYTKRDYYLKCRFRKAKKNFNKRSSKKST